MNRNRKLFVSAAEAATVRDAKRVVTHKFPHATDVVARRANPMRAADGFVAEFNA